MRTIVKGAEPASLTVHRRSLHSDYSNYAAKDDLRAVLVAEQCGLCCYCMSRIRPDSALMKIEHWRCQAHYPGEQLDYGNLLATCLGGQGQGASGQHCDTSKGNQELRWNPANPAALIETRVHFDRDGSIRSNDHEFGRQLNDVLNLNLQWLKNNRESVIKGIEDWWKKERMRSRNPAARDRLVGKKRSRYIDAEGELTEYCQVAAYWLDKGLAGMTP